MKRSLLSLVIFSALSQSGHIQAEETKESTEHLQVWGAKIKSSSVYIEERDISARQADHLSDLLRQIPGVDVGGSHSINQRINVRGLDDTDLEVLVDGASQNNYQFHHSGNLQINPDILKEVDIQVGTNSVVHSGLGGAIEFRTKSANELLDEGQTIGGRVLVGYNSNASKYASATAYAKLGKAIDVLVYANQLDRDNFNDGTGLEVQGGKGTLDNQLIKFGWDISDEQRIYAKYDVYKDEGDYPIRPDFGVRFNRDPETGLVTLLPTNYDRDTISLHYELNKGDLINLRADLFQNTSELRRISNGVLSTGESENTGLTLIANSAFGEHIFHQLTYGLKWIDADARNGRTGDPDTERAGFEENDTIGIFLEDRIELNNGLAITPGVRFNRQSKVTSAIPDKQTWTDWQTALAVEYPITQAWTIAASTTELFKGPEQGEIFVDAAGNNLFNPDLQPETGRNNEISLKYGADNIAGLDSLRAAFNYFRTDIDDLIEEIFADADCQSRGCDQIQANVGEVEIRGFESSVFVGKGPFDALLTFARSDADRITPLEGSAPLNRDVGDSATLRLSYDLSRYDLALSWLWRRTFSKETELANNFVKPSFNVHSITAVWEPESLAPGLNVTLGVENLFDTAYTSHASRIGFSSRDVNQETPLNDFEPGRNIKLSVAYQF